MRRPGRLPRPRRRVPADELFVLVGTPGSMHLMLAGPGGLRPVGSGGLPSTAAWLSGGRRTLLVTTLAGDVFSAVGGPDAGAGASQAPWSTGSGDLAGARPSRAFGSLDAGADMVVLGEGEPGSGGPGRLVVDTLAGRPVRTMVLSAALESAPAWLPDGRIAVIVRDRSDQPRVMVADLVSGTLDPASGEAVRAVAVGGATVAVIGLDGTVTVNSVVGWLAATSGRPIPAGDLGADQGILQAVPSLAGHELALVVSNADGDATDIRVMLVGDGQEIARYELPPGANRAVAGWLVAD